MWPRSFVWPAWPSRRSSATAGPPPCGWPERGHRALEGLPDADADRRGRAGRSRACGGEVHLEREGWSWAFPLAGLGGTVGHMLVAADVPPAQPQMFLLGLLAQHAGSRAGQRRSAPPGAGDGHRANGRWRKRLSAEEPGAGASGAGLGAGPGDRHAAELVIHDRLTRAVVTGTGEEAIAQAAHELVRRPVAIEDRFGTLIAWAGPDRPDPYPKLPTPGPRAPPRRLRWPPTDPCDTRGRVLAVASVGDEPLGASSSSIPTTRLASSTSWHSSTPRPVLAPELARQRSVADTEHAAPRRSRRRAARREAPRGHLRPVPGDGLRPRPPPPCGRPRGHDTPGRRRRVVPGRPASRPRHRGRLAARGTRRSTRRARRERGRLGSVPVRRRRRARPGRRLSGRRRRPVLASCRLRAVLSRRSRGPEPADQRGRPCSRSPASTISGSTACSPGPSTSGPSTGSSTGGSDAARLRRHEGCRACQDTEHLPGVRRQLRRHRRPALDTPQQRAVPAGADTAHHWMRPRRRGHAVQPAARRHARGPRSWRCGACDAVAPAGETGAPKFVTTGGCGTTRRRVTLTTRFPHPTGGRRVP